MIVTSVLPLLASLALGGTTSLPMPPPPARVAKPPKTPPPAAAPVEAPAPPAADPTPTPATSAPSKAAATDEKPALLVSDLVAQGVEPAQAAGFTDAVVQTLEERKLFRVLSSRDVQTVLSAERKRQLLGQCAEADESCASDLGDSLGARFVLTGSLSKLGDTYELALTVLDTVKGRRVGRSTRLSSSLDVLRQQLPYAVSEASGSPLPPPPSRVLPYSMIAAGSAAFLGGGVLGMFALSRESVLNKELCPGGDGACAGESLTTRASYAEENADLGRQKTAGLLLMVGGAALAAAGVWLMPPPEGGPRVAVFPTHHGFAIAGTFR